MPSIFDEDRKKLGLDAVGGDSSSPSSGSLFDGERMDLGLMEDTRPKKQKPSASEQKQIMNEKRLNDNNPRVSLPSVVEKQPEKAVKTKFTHPADLDAPAPKITNQSANMQNAFSPKAPIKGQLKAPTLSYPTSENLTPYEKWYIKNVEPTILGKVLGGLQKADRAVSNVKAGALDTATLGATNGLGRAAIAATPGGKQNLEPIRQERMDTPSYKTGEMLGYLPPGALAEKGVAKLGGKALEKAPKLVQSLTKAAGAGALDAAAQEGGDVAFRGGKFDPWNVAIGAGGGAAFPLAGKGISMIRDKVARTAEELLQNSPIYRSMVHEIGESGTRAEIGKQQLADVDNQIQSLSKSTAPDKAAQYQALFNERNEVINYIKQHEPDFEAPKPRVTADKNTGSLTKVQDPQAPQAAPEAPTPTVDPAPSEAPMQLQPELPPPQPRTPNTPKFINTLENSPKPPQTFKEKLKAKYTPITNQESVNLANKRVSDDIEEAASFVMSDSKATPEKVTVAHRLIDEFTKQGNHERAVDIAEKIAVELTRAGQTVQAASIYNRLTPSGVLVHAKRIAKKTSEKFPLRNPVKVTTEQSEQLTDLAQTMQKMTGVNDLASDVTAILEKAKKGEKLADGEADTLRRFVEESKQFVTDASKRPARPPRAPRAPKDKRVRDNVASFLDAQEKAARERLKARGTRASAMPLDIYADYAIIGAAKLGKGTIKFADWSEQMVKDLGEEVRPALHAIYERAVETYEKASKKITTSTISEAEKIAERVIKNKALSEKESESIRVLAQKVSGLSGDAKRMASQDLQAVLQTLERPGILKKVSSVQTMAQLMNPKTLLIRNPIGNELFYRVERLNKILATPIDWTRVKLFGGQRSVTFRTHNQGQYWKNFIEGAKAGWKGVNVNGLETQFDLSGPAFSNKWNPLTYLEKAMGASLRSFDNAAYMRAVNNSLGELATLRAINEGQRGNKALIKKYIREADENMLKIADEYGKYVTLQDNNIISKGLTATKRGLNLGKDFGLGDMILKYPKTPGAILMRAIEYSPVGFLRSAYIAFRPLIKKDPNTAEAMMALTRAITGTVGFTGLGYFLYDKGILRGAASKDKDIRDLEKSAGKGQYQVNLSALMRWAKSGFDPKAAELKEGDTMYTYDWLQPVSIAASIGANIGQNLDEKKGVSTNIGNTIMQSLNGGINTLTEQSVLSGLKQAAEGYPGQTVTDKITDILSDMPASFVPSTLNQIKQLDDNARRETYDPALWKQSLNKAKAKIPGLSRTLPQQYDTLGKSKQTWQNNSAANVFLNPGSPSKYELSPEAKFVVDLINETGDETLAPRVPGKSITVDGVSVKLTGDQFSRLQQLQGEETAKRINKINPASSLESKSKKMQKGLTDAGKTAKKTLAKEYNLK
jgi:hypothetical protein